MASAYARLQVYCFSGTGNALSAGQWMVQRAQARGIPGMVTPIDRLTGPLPGQLDVSEPQRLLLGFIHATHGFCVPWLMLKFLLRFPARQGRPVDVFLANTRGGTKFGPLVVPGVSGIALLLPWLVLLFKGYRVVGTQPVDLPSNWMQLHPPQGAAVQEALVQRRRVEVDRFADALLDGRHVYHGGWTLPLDLALLPVTLGYLAVGRFGLGKLQVPSNACNGCGVCQRSCPADAIRMVRERPYWTWACEACMRCVSVCPRRAVEVSHSGLVLMLIPWLLGWGILERAVAAAVSPLQDWPWVSAVVSAVASYVLTLVLILGPYALLWWLLRVPAINAVLTRTSLTHYWGRYLTPGLRRADLVPRAERAPPSAPGQL